MGLMGFSDGEMYPCPFRQCSHLQRELGYTALAPSAVEERAGSSTARQPLGGAGRQGIRSYRSSALAKVPGGRNVPQAGRIYPKQTKDYNSLPSPLLET
jgi:hypothetical protein